MSFDKRLVMNEQTRAAVVSRRLRSRKSWRVSAILLVGTRPSERTAMPRQVYR